MPLYIPEQARETMDTLDEQGYLIHVLFLDTESCNLHSYTSNKQDVLQILGIYLEKNAYSRTSEKSIVRIMYVGKGRQLSPFIHSIGDPSETINIRYQRDRRIYVPIDYSLCTTTAYTDINALRFVYDAMGVDGSVPSDNFRFYNERPYQVTSLVDRIRSFYKKPSFMLPMYGKIGLKRMYVISSEDNEKKVYVWYDERLQMFSAQTDKPDENVYVKYLRNKFFDSFEDTMNSYGGMSRRMIGTADGLTFDYIRQELQTIRVINATA